MVSGTGVAFMARVEVSIFLTAALVFGLGCGVARQVTPNSPTPPPQVAEAESLYDYVITNELYYDYKSPQRRSLECFAIDADANVQVIANCPGEISGNDYVPDIVYDLRNLAFVADRFVQRFLQQLADRFGGFNVDELRQSLSVHGSGLIQSHRLPPCAFWWIHILSSA